MQSQHQTAESSLLDVVNLVLRGWRVVAATTFGGAAMFAAISLLIHPTYVSRTSFIQAEPSRALLSGNLGTLASRFGVIAPPGDATLSLDFLQQTLTSQDVLDTVLNHPLLVARPKGPSSARGSAALRLDTIELASWIGVEDNNPAKRLDRLRRKILKRVTVETHQRSGIVRVSVALRDPYVAAALARALVEALNQFNLHTRQTVSRANRAFVEVRVEDARTQLADAESRLRQFYEANRRIADAPALLFEEGRLKRRVELAQQLYLTLAQQLEQARIDEVKDTPVLTVIETATPPVRKSAPKRTVLTLMGAFVGAVLGILFMLVARQMRRAAHLGSPAWIEFSDHLSSLWPPWRRRRPMPRSDLRDPPRGE